MFRTEEAVTEDIQRRYLMNTCLVCNAVFLTKKAGSDGIEKLRKLRSILLRVQNENDGVVPETNVLCRNCNKAVDEVLKLKRQIQSLVKMLEEVRRRLGKRIVDSYGTTNKNRKNFHLKKEMFEAWYSKCNGVPGPTELEQRFLSILDDLDHHQNISEKTSSSVSLIRVPECADISSNLPDEHYDSMGCLSPMSVPPVDNDFGGGLSDGGGSNHDDEIIVPNLVELKASNTGPSSNLVTNNLPHVITSENTLNQISVPPANKISNGEAVKDQNFASTANCESSQLTYGKFNITIKGNVRKQRPIIKTKRRNHPCKFCGKLFPTDFSLQMHERTHTGEKPFACSICNRPFNNKAAMQKHELTHDPSRYQGEPQFECDICGKKYYLKLTLASHKRQHEGIKREKAKKPRDPNAPPPKPKNHYKCHRCHVCGKPYYHTRKLREHIQSHNPTFSYNKYFRYQCPICPPEKLGFGNKIAVRRHIRKEHPDEPVPDQFKNTWNERRNLKNKEQRQSTTRPRRRRTYKPRETTTIRKSKGRPKKSRICPHCGKEFKYNENFVYHIRLHTGEKPFRCEICDRRFICKGNMQKHMKSHDPARFSGEGSHVCDICGKAFHLRGSLYHHRRRHLGLENYKTGSGWAEYRAKLKRPCPCECQICGQKFENQLKLNAHKYYKHSEKRLNCETCEKPFYDAKSLRIHVKTHNPTYLYNKLFRYQCPACPSEMLGYPSKKSIVIHWREAHADQELPNDFKIPPPPQGEYKCTKCEAVDGIIPTYRNPGSLHRHNKLYHAENARLKRRKWRPLTASEKVVKAANRSKRRDPTRSKLINSDEDSDSASDLEFDSDSDKETETTKTPTRRSVRETRGRMTNLTKLLNGPDSDEDEESMERKMIESEMLRIAKTSKNSVMRKKLVNSKTRATNKINNQEKMRPRHNTSSKLSDSHIREMLGGKDLRIILTRINVCELTNSSVQQENANLPVSATRRSHAEEPVRPRESLPKPTRGNISAMEVIMDEDSIDDVPANDPLYIPEEPQACSLALPEEIKVETDDCIDDELLLHSNSASTSRSWISSSAPLALNGPIIIHNPLSKNKASNPIVIHPTSSGNE